MWVDVLWRVGLLFPSLARLADINVKVKKERCVVSDMHSQTEDSEQTAGSEFLFKSASF